MIDIMRARLQKEVYSCLEIIADLEHLIEGHVVNRVRDESSTKRIVKISAIRFWQLYTSRCNRVYCVHGL